MTVPDAPGSDASVTPASADDSSKTLDEVDELETVDVADMVVERAATSSTQTASRVPRIDVLGTVVFAVAVVVAVPLRSERSGQVVIAATSMVLFAVGVATCLWAYTSALERSRVHEVGVANLFLLTGRTAPAPVKRTMLVCLTAQVVLAIAGASIGVAGLDANELNALAFGVLVPMFGIGMNGIWAARHGSFGPRGGRSTQPSNRKID